jgi:hypothetical protein
MARPQPPQPDPDDLWPACDEQPPGISIRPLRHGDLQALLAHLNHHHEHDDKDESLVAAPVGRRPAAAGPQQSATVNLVVLQHLDPHHMAPARIAVQEPRTVAV